MPASLENIERTLRERFPDAVIEIEDLRGDGTHVSVYVESSLFEGLPVMDQHRMIHDSLQGIIGNEWRSLTLKTAASAAAQRA